MPFIYQDLKLEVLNDFVELTLSSLDSSTLNSQPYNTYDRRSAIEKMRDYRRALFLGEGGIGKTTFFRFATLNIMGLTPGERVVNRSEKAVPFFVPLKALDNTSEHPLLDTLTDSNPLLGKNKAKAIAKLIKLAERRHAVFLLDGFDEIPYAGGNEPLKQEVAALFSALDEALSGPISRSQYADFYREARGCRVYLSSRREFFLAHPVNAPRDVPRWEVTGLTDKRGSLVGNIFRHYKKINPETYVAALNVEQFMRQLSLAKDAGFEQISQNPLFLTVICFVYANEINLGCQPGDMFKNSSSVLIERCIKLLLSGIDDAKTKNLSKIDARALMNRRSAWPDQKFVGLQFVASQAYLEHLGALSLANLTQHLITFFKDNPHISECDDILRGLSKSDPLANIAVQLTLSGVLVVIDRRGSQAIYDFPHRSFKEKLAISYFTSPTGLNKLKDKIGDPSFHELVLLVADTKIGWTTITEAIASSIRGPNCDSTGNLLLQALARAPSTEEATRVARHILESAIGEPDSSFYLPKRMQSFLPGDDAYKATLTVLMKRVIQANDYWSFALIAEALVVTSKGDRPHVLQSIQDLLPAASDMDWQTLHIVRGLNDPSELRKCLTWILARRPPETANDSMTGVFFIALVGQAANREIVRSCLYNWLVQSSDIRARFFEEEETFNQVFDVYAATTKIIDNKVRPYFARGRVPELQRPWR